MEQTYTLTLRSFENGEKLHEKVWRGNVKGKITVSKVNKKKTNKDYI